MGKEGMIEKSCLSFLKESSEMRKYNMRLKIFCQGDIVGFKKNF